MAEVIFKQVYLKRMAGAVICNVIIQVVFLSIFLLFIDIDIFHPLSWIRLWYRNFISFKTWLYLFPLCSVIFAQGIVCSREYISVPQVQSTRCSIIKSVFSVHNAIVGALHLFIGYNIPWIYTSLSGDDFNSFTVSCESPYHKSCLVEERLFIVLGGAWMGFYYFVQNFLLTNRFVTFPIVQQHKLVQVKATFLNTVKGAMQYVIVPTGIYVLLYYLRGSSFRRSICRTFSLELKNKPMDSLLEMLNLKVLVLLWMFSSIFVVSMKLMELLFKIFLTQRHTFPISHSNDAKDIILEEGLRNRSVPILQHLAFLDLYLLSEKSEPRRKEIFTVSLPGGHPHTWNAIKKHCFEIIRSFTVDFENALKIPPKEFHLSQSVRTPFVLRSQDGPRGKSPQRRSPLEDPVGRRSGMRPAELSGMRPAELSGMRPAELSGMRPADLSALDHSGRQRRLQVPPSPRERAELSRVQHQHSQGHVYTPEVLVPIVTEWFNNKVKAVKNLAVVNYFLGDIHETRVENLILHCLPVMWATQSLSLLACSSLNEDNYGVMQNDLTNIIVSLLQLKQVLDSHVKRAGTLKKSPKQNVFVTKMRNSLRASIKRSLYRLAISFKSFISDIQLPVEAEKQMLSFIAFKES